jgi:2-octaprenyl-6-methoxyphenol hydroxylase
LGSTDRPQDGQLLRFAPEAAQRQLPIRWAALHEVVMNDSETRISADVCIMGAGPVGGSLACFLAQSGVSTVAIDRAPLKPMEHPTFDGRAYAISAGSRRLLDESGLWSQLPEPAQPIQEIRVSDGRVGRPASRLFLHFDHKELGPETGPFGWMVEARGLRIALNAQLPMLPALRVLAPAEATVERRADGATVSIAGGPRIECRLVIAAEGRNSPLREQAGIPVTRLPYGQTGMTFAITHELPHHGIALEHFLPAGPFALLPMAPSADALAGGAPNVSALVWTERTAAADRMMALDDARFEREAARRLGDHLGKIKLVGRRWSYPLSAMLAHRYTDTRLALAGDAAHGIHPIAGQGLNLGFRDAIVLGDLIVEVVRTGQDPGSAALLARYQRARRPDNIAMLAMTDGLDRLFSSDNRLLRLARDVGIAAVHRTPPLKRLFMRQAMGTNG